MARRVIVTYRVKPERVEEHEGLIRAVFAELEEKAPEGLRYSAYKRADGLRFVHVAIVEAERNPLDTLAAFKAFSEKVRERCDELPEVTEVTEIGDFGF